MIEGTQDKVLQPQESFGTGTLDAFNKAMETQGKTLPLKQGDELTPEQKLAAAEKLIKDKEDAKKGQNQGSNTDDVNKSGDELTDEQIQAKLDELAKKDEKDLTVEEKAFILEKTGEGGEVDEITRVKSVFETKYGIELKNQYENSEVGLTQMVDEVAPVIAEQLLANYFATVPGMKAFYDHVVVEQRSIETFMARNEKPAFLNIPVKEITSDMGEENKVKAENNLKALIKLDLQNKGVGEDDIEDFIALAESGNKLYEKGKAAKDSLTKSHTAAVEAKLKAEEQQKAADAKQIEEETTALIAMIDKNDFNGISIPATDLKAFKEAMTRKDGRGNTLLDYKRAKLTLAQFALLDYLVFKDVKIPGLSKAVTTTNRKFSFKKAAEENDARNGGRTRGAGAEGKGQEMIFDPRNVNFDNMVSQRRSFVQ